MASEKFLKQVADYYISKDIDMTNTTFVFPNRRSAIFMRKYMHDSMDRPMFMPRMVSITYFIQQFNDTKLASNTELVFILYKVYCRLLTRHNSADQIPEFDRFYFLATIVLNDFNDIDAYMVDADQLYQNLKNLKEIKSYYLTDDQKEVIRYLWGEPKIETSPDEFWAHISHNEPSLEDEQKAAAKFLNLWQMMGELYRDFKKTLLQSNPPLAYTGMQSRHACEQIKSMGVADFRGMRYVFVGFNVLSTARTQIFKRLKDLGIADFFWDTASELIRSDQTVHTSSGRFILPLAKAFPMPPDFELQPIQSKPDIEIISVPSNFGQAKVAAHILEQWAQQWREEGQDIKPDTLVDTAIVLADDHLLMPMLHSITPEIEPINVTMGISYSSTPFAALMTAIISMHLRVRRIKSTGQLYYYYQDVVDVLSHPHIALIAPKISTEIKDKIMRDHLYNVSAKRLTDEYPQLAFLFRQIDDQRDISQVKGYITGLIDTLSAKLTETQKHKDNERYYELEILKGYTDAVSELCSLIERYGVTVHESTFLKMIERAIALTPANFAGKPLKGLQIMSVMDTRSLDFDRIIMLSMNERTFPKRNYRPTLIPMTLRSGYYLPTQEHEESSYAYQFYRLISRAEKVRLLYDSRTAGVTSGEMSRYLSQLLHLHQDYGIKVRTAEFSIEADEFKPICVNKTPEVLRQLERFKPGGDRNLSASALKAYVSCPLKFYLQVVKGMHPDNEILEYIDAASYGTVLHRVAQDLYLAHKGQIINEHTLEAMKHEDLEQRALAVLDHIYYKDRYKDHLSDIPGEGQIISKIISKYVRKMLESEKSMVPYEFLEAEFGEHIKHEWQVDDKHTINFTMSVDRIDRMRDPEDPSSMILRFIDYKTGSDSLDADNVDELFDNSKTSGIFQLLLYSHAYRALYGYEGKIKPLIYKFQEIPSDGIVDLKVEKKEIGDYRDVEGFYERFTDMINKIFETENEYPFCQAQDIKHCKYCPFTQMCGRFPEDN